MNSNPSILVDLDALSIQIQALGYDRRTADHYAALIGDTPMIDADGLTCVEDDHGQVLARLKLPEE